VIFAGGAAISPYELAQQGGSVEYMNDEAGTLWLIRIFEHSAAPSGETPGTSAGVHALDADRVAESWGNGCLL
jgi:hypothetical protein